MASLYPSAPESSSSTLKANKPVTENRVSSTNQEKAKPLYDMHHMSINEFKEMAYQMYSDSSLSEDDYVRVGVEQVFLELFSGNSAETKLDILNEVQNGIDAMKSNPYSNGVEKVQQTLDLLKGIDARFKCYYSFLCIN